MNTSVLAIVTKLQHSPKAFACIQKINVSPLKAMAKSKMKQLAPNTKKTDKK